MAEGKNIPIKISATGGDAAAAEIRKVVSAAEEVTETTAPSSGFGGMLDGVPERAEEAAEAVAQVGAAAVPMSEHMGEAADETERLAEAAEDASDNSEKLDENVGKIARAQKAQALAQLAGHVGEIGRKFKEVGAEVGEFDVELGQTLTRTGESIERVSSGVSTLALGFAVGGPLGGAIAGLVVGLKETAVAWEEMAIAQAKATRAEAQAVEMAAKLQDAIDGGLESALAAGEASDALTRNYQAETEALDALVAATNRRNQVLEAAARADAAGRDREDAAAVRAGAAPEDVAARRAIGDAERAKALVDQKLAQQREAEQGTYQAKAAVDREVQSLATNPAALPEQLDSAYQKQSEAAKAAAKATADRVTAEQIAAERKREIDFRTVGKLEGLGSDKQQRLKEERERAAKEAESERKKKETEDRRARLEDLEARRDTAKERLDESARTDGLKVRGAGQRSGNDLLQRVGKSLSDGTSAAEIQKLGDLVNESRNEVDAATLAALTKLLAGFTAQAQKIQNLEGQIKNLRTGK